MDLLNVIWAILLFGGMAIAFLGLGFVNKDQ